MRSLHRRALVASGMLTMAICFLERQTLAALAPTVCRDLGVSNTGYGWASSAFALALLVGTPLAGSFLDRAGVRRGLVAAVAVWSLVSAAHGLMAGLAGMILLRFLLGLAESPSFPGSAQVVRSVLPPGEVARGMGFVLTGSTLGAVSALFLAVALEQRFGWRVAFAGVAAISAAWVPIWIWLSSSGAAPAHLDVPRGAAPPAAWSVVSHPAVVRSVLFTLAVAPMSAFALLWWPKFLVARYGIAQAGIARYTFLLPLSYDLGAILCGALAARFRRDAVLLTGACLALAVGLIPLSQGPWLAVASAAVAYFGVGGSFAISTAAALVAVDRSAVSRAGALVATANSLAFAIWNPLIGWSVDRTGSYALALGCLTLLVPAGIAAWLAFTPRVDALARAGQA